MKNLVVEKRKHKRKKCEIVVDLNSPSETDQYISKGCVKDISMGGIRLESCQKLDPKDILITFEPDSFLGGMSISGKITRVEKDKLSYSYGVEFRSLRFWEKIKLWYKTSVE